MYERINCNKTLKKVIKLNVFVKMSLNIKLKIILYMKQKTIYICFKIK